MKTDGKSQVAAVVYSLLSPKHCQVYEQEIHVIANTAVAFSSEAKEM